MMRLFPTDELNLQWKDFESNLAQSFYDMRNDSDFFDVQIGCFEQKSEIDVFGYY